MLIRQTRAEPSHAPTVKSRNSAYNFANSLTAHCRGGALLHLKNLAGSQGLSGRAMLAPTIESQKSDIFLRKPCPLLVGACIASPPTVQGQILGSAGTANAGRASPAPTLKSRKNAYNFANSLAAHRRGGALLHPKSLAAPQGLSGRAMLAPTIESQKSDLFFAKTLPFARRGLHCRPANGTACFWYSRSPPIRAKTFPYNKKDPQTKPFAGLSSWCTIGDSPAG